MENTDSEKIYHAFVIQKVQRFFGCVYNFAFGIKPCMNHFLRRAENGNRVFSEQNPVRLIRNIFAYDFFQTYLIIYFANILAGVNHRELFLGKFQILFHKPVKTHFFALRFGFFFERRKYISDFFTAAVHALYSVC